MRGPSRFRITPETAAAGACMGIALLPSLWVSWQAPVARGMVLPAVTILLLALLPREEAGGDDAIGRQKGRRNEASRSGLLGTVRQGALGVRSVLLALVTHPALLYLLWGAICATRTGMLIGGGRGGRPLPDAADFARGELIRLTAGVAVYLAVAVTARQWERARQWVDALLAAVVGATVVAFLSHRAEDPALVGPFGNAQLLAATLLLLTPLAVVVATTARNGQRRAAATGAAVLGLAALALTQTRSAWLGGLAALLVLVSLLRQVPQRRRRRWTGQPTLHRPSGASTPVLVSAMLVLAALGWLVCHSDLSGPITARAATLTRLSDDAGAAWRLRQWRLALALARERPVAGYGLGSYPLAAAPRLPQPIPLSVARAVGPNLSLNAHNLYLQLLAETGGIGLGLYLWMLAAFFLSGLRACRRRDHRFRSLVLVACMAGIAGQAVDALANPAYQFLDVRLFFWVLLGLGTAMAQNPPRRLLPEAAELHPVLDRNDEEREWEVLGRESESRAPRPLLYPLRLAAALAGVGVLAAGSVAGAPPLNQASYLPLREFRVEARTTPGYMRQTLLPGESVEMRGVGTLFSGEEQDATDQTTFSRAGGTAPADSLQQLPAPHGNLFYVPTGVPASYDGLTLSLQGTFQFNGQTLAALGPTLTLSVPRAAPGVQAAAVPRVIPPTGEMVPVEIQFTAPDMRFQGLHKVDANETLAPDDVRILDDTHVMLRATSTEPGRRIYTLRCRFLDRRNQTWMTPVQVYVR